MPALDATLGGSTANSYQTVAEADAYFTGTLRESEWAALTPEVKSAALVAAAAWLDTLKYGGKKCHPSSNDDTLPQSMKWPGTTAISLRKFSARRAPIRRASSSCCPGSAAGTPSHGGRSISPAMAVTMRPRSLDLNSTTLRGRCVPTELPMPRERDGPSGDPPVRAPRAFAPRPRPPACHTQLTFKEITDATSRCM